VRQEREGILLHACCAPCATHVIEVLSKNYTVTIYFYNPNIYPEQEYERRLKDVERVCSITGTFLVVADYDNDAWNERVKGLEDEPEGGRRCAACFEMRLARTAGYAAENAFKLFASTLTVSPHKNAPVINGIGNAVCRLPGTRYLESDFKKNDGFKKSCNLSRLYGLYRQSYCGCIYSME